MKITPDKTSRFFEWLTDKCKSCIEKSRYFYKNKISHPEFKDWLRSKSKVGNDSVKSSVHSRFFPPTAHIEEVESASIATAIVVTVIAIIVIFIIWAALTPIEEIAVTHGEVVPKDKIYVIQNLEGGTIADLPVKEGDEVKAGQTIAVFDTTAPELELEQTEARNAGLIANAKELSELLQRSEAGLPPSGAERAPIVNVPPSEEVSATPTAAETSAQTTAPINHERHTKSSTATSNTNAKSSKTSKGSHATKTSNTHNVSKVLNQKNYVSEGSQASNSSQYTYVYGQATASQTAASPGSQKITAAKVQAQQDLYQFDSVLDILKRRLDILIQEKKMYETLLATGVVSQKDYLTLLSNINEVQEEISKTQAAHVETEYLIQKLEERLQHTNVTSPIHGLVKGLQVHVGNVIQPGGVLMNVVPMERLMVETKVSVTDIGHVQVGDPVKIKVDAYNYTQYGYIQGKLISLSATTFTDEPTGTTTPSVPYYKGLVELAQSYVGVDPTKNHLMPGMTVEADITTGTRSLLEYLLRPVRIMVTSSFREY